MRSLSRIALILTLIVILGMACGSSEVRYEGPEEVEPEGEIQRQQQQQTHDLMDMQQRIREQARDQAPQ